MSAEREILQRRVSAHAATLKREAGDLAVFTELASILGLDQETCTPEEIVDTVRALKRRSLGQ